MCETSIVSYFGVYILEDRCREAHKTNHVYIYTVQYIFICKIVI